MQKIRHLSPTGSNEKEGCIWAKDQGVAKLKTWDTTFKPVGQHRIGSKIYYVLETGEKKKKRIKPLIPINVILKNYGNLHQYRASSQKIIPTPRKALIKL